MVPVEWSKSDGGSVPPSGSANGVGASPWAQVCEVVIMARNTNFLGAMTRGFVSDGVAACVHQVEAVRELRLNDGELEDMRAARAHLHTRVTLVEHIARVVRRTYEEWTSVVAVPLVGGDPAYAEWVLAATSAPVLHVPPGNRLVGIW